MKRLLLLLALCLIPLAIPATGMTPPQDTTFRTLYGKLTDSHTGQPVPYASVTLEGSSLSNVTNSEGFFSLKVPADTPEDGNLLFHHLGYLNATRPVSAFQAGTADKPLSIILAPMSIQLDPSIIRDIDPMVLLQTAYRHVRDNYPQQHEHLIAFYREMIRKGNIKYLALNEAVVDVDKAPYSGFTNDKAAIYKGRGSKNFSPSDTLFVHFQGGIIGTLSGDVVKDPFVGCRMDDISKCYDLDVEGSATLDGRECLIIRFREKPDKEESILFDGRLFIDSETYAIARVEYAMNVKGREEKAAAHFVVRKPADFRIAVNQAQYSLNFKEIGGRWHFDYSRMELIFTARRKKSLFRHSYTVLSEMAVTDIRPEEFKITREDRVRFNDILSNQVSDFSDPDFWGSYNIIEPDQTIESAVRRIIRQIKARE